LQVAANNPEGEMATDKFFDETREQSIVKSEIVEKYFDTWASIIASSQQQHRPRGANRIGYIDLFAGPGRYKDGATSTPLRVLQKALEKDTYSDRLVTIFNDKDEANVRSLQEAIERLPGINRLKVPPQIGTKRWEIESQGNLSRLTPYLSLPSSIHGATRALASNW
jgi:three-Cys-motif partner protein